MFMPSPPQAPPAVVTTHLQKHAIGECSVLDSGLGSIHNNFGVSPISYADMFFKDFDFHDAQIKILTEPKHGVLESAPVDAPNQPFPAAHAENTTYVANEGYVGHDKFSVRVWDKKYDITIYYDVQSFDGLPSLDIANDNPWCNSGPYYGSFKISDSGMESSPLPTPDPGQPLPSLPYDLSLLALSARRKSSATTTSSDAASHALTLATPRADVTTATTLTNGDFASSTGWSTAGSVTIANGEAVLGEDPASQTRLSQSFTLGANDRFLRFTLSNVALQNPGDRPEDAFQVAKRDTKRDGGN